MQGLKSNVIFLAGKEIKNKYLNILTCFSILHNQSYGKPYFIVILDREICKECLSWPITVISMERNYSTWNNIIVVAEEDNYTLGLKSSGKIVAVESYFHRQCDVNDWNISLD